MWTIILTICVSLSMIMSLVCCLCWRKKTPKNEWLGLEGMVTQKNPDENVNHLPSASCVVDGLNASGESLDSNKRGVPTNTKRSLPDIPSEQGTAVNWEPTGDNSSEHYATVGQYPNNGIKKPAISNGIEARPSISQHSSISQADDAFSPYERVKYDKIKPKEHPYAQLQPTNSRPIVYEESPSSVEERTNLLRVENVTASAEPLAPTRSRRSSAHSNAGAATLDIPAASAVAGGIAASPELPYMTPPVAQTNFSGDSQDSTKGYTSISVREPLADILAQTKEMNKKKRELDPHYSTVSDDSDDVYTTIPDPNNQIYTSESETYARIPALPITVEAEVNHPPSQSPVGNEEESEVEDQLYEPPPHSADGPKSSTHSHSHSRQASSSSSIAAIGSPKPEKRQANSPLPPPPLATSFDFHSDKLQAMRNLDDLYAKVHKTKKDDSSSGDDRSSDKSTSRVDAMIRNASAFGKSFEERPQSDTVIINSRLREHNYETLKKSPRKISDPGYEKIKNTDDIGYASINGPESLTNSSDPGYEVLKNRTPSECDPNYEQLRHKNSNLSDYGYSRVKEKIIDGYAVVNKKKKQLNVGQTFSSDNDNTEPNYESMPNDVNTTVKSDPNYESVCGRMPDPNYESVASQKPDPNYESVSQKSDPNYESVSQKSDANYESVSQKSDPNYESVSLTDPNYESVKDADPPYEKLDEDSSRTNSDLSGYEKVKGSKHISSTDNSTSSNGKSDSEPPYEQLTNESESEIPGYEKIGKKGSDNSLSNRVNTNENKTNENQLDLTYIHEEDAIFQV